MIALNEYFPAEEPKGDHYSFPFQWHAATAQWWDDLGLFPAHPEVSPLHHIPDITLPTLHQMCGLSWYRGLADPPPPFITPEPPLRTAPLSDPLPMQPLTPPFSPTVPHLPCPSTLLMGLGIRLMETPLVPMTARWLGNGWRKSGAGGGGIKVHNFSMLCLTKKLWTNKGPIPPCPSTTNPERLRRTPWLVAC